MHIAKNVCENITGIILNIDGKSKENFQSRLDLVDMGIRRDLHPQVLLNGKYRLPPPIFAMSKEEKEVFCMVLKDIKVSDAYASNISRCVSLKDQRLYSLKSHDYHILMQDLLPVALRCCMLKNVTPCIIELSNIMKAICGKVLNVEELEKVQDQAALTLCNLEKIFPPSFFTIMVYLVIHLLRKVIIGGPIFYRWMYSIKRFLSKLKFYCRNKRYPEESIAEGYLAEEYMIFCSRYLEDVETRLNRPSRNAGLNDPNLAETYLFQSYGEQIAESGGTRRGRGRALLIDLYDLNPAEHVTVRRNSHGETKGEEGRVEVVASTDSSVNHEDIDNRIITEVLGPERYGRVRFQGSGVTPTQYFRSNSQQYMPSGSHAQAEVQRLKDQIAQMQASTVEQIAEVQRKYEELQQQLIVDATAREAAAAAREVVTIAREAEAAAMAAE
ncbi:hypothetical protein J1N35_045129 [Gossypium stocksii]|uniref:DUF4218 domain-containing protein n=1 Tax=Gossypium stocksii TaxID=47602 RepID=A0A9D3UAN5_9ROSI|nr:hypothetical protein J1N35_045129 [Gossypium stocksii]